MKTAKWDRGEVQFDAKKRLGRKQDKGEIYTFAWAGFGFCANGHEIKGATRLSKAGKCECLVGMHMLTCSPSN